MKIKPRKISAFIGVTGFCYILAAIVIAVIGWTLAVWGYALPEKFYLKDLTLAVWGIVFMCGALIADDIFL